MNAFIRQGARRQECTDIANWMRYSDGYYGNYKKILLWEPIHTLVASPKGRSISACTQGECRTY